MRALFISRDYRALDDGGKIVTKRNLDLLKQNFVQVDVILKPKANIITLAKNYFLRESYGATRAIVKEFKTLLKHKRYDLIWFDGSCDGSFVKLAKKYRIPTVCFYHNIETSFYKDKARATGRLLDNLIVPYIRSMEKAATENSSYRVMLNERDSHTLESLYHKSGNLILPTSFPALDVDCLTLTEDSSDPYLLFVGSNFWANEEGLLWFFENVAPYVDINIKIIGSICNAFSDKHLPQNVDLLGRVEVLDDYYANAAAVISPILSGSGTKTKTIEALRYGKTIIGSQEALMGIPSQYYNNIGFLCDTPEDYLQAIKAVSSSGKSERINKESLKVFEKIFSEDAVADKLNDFLIDNILK